MTLFMRQREYLYICNLQSLDDCLPRLPLIMDFFLFGAINIDIFKNFVKLRKL